MEFLFSEDQEQFRENIARFLADRSPPTEVRTMADDQGPDPEVWSMLSNQLAFAALPLQSNLVAPVSAHKASHRLRRNGPRSVLRTISCVGGVRSVRPLPNSG